MKLIDEETYQGIAIGGKAQVLFELQKAGFPVPPLRCLAAATIQSYVDDSSLMKITQLLEQLKEVDEGQIEQISLSLQQVLRDCLKTSDFFQELKEALSKEEGPLFSVRSSASQEDSVETSFAGQFDTQLSVIPEEIPDAVLQCLCSQFAANVLRYCREKQVNLMPLSLSVIIQEMIIGETSGILFTANPQGLLNEAVVVIGAGTGDQVVLDKVPTTTYYYHVTDQQFYYEQQLGGPLIDSQQLVSLIQLGEQLAKHFDQAVDIEFTWQEGQLYVLQARPITTLSGEIGTILDNSNIVESYPGLTLPLSYSFIQEAYAGVFRGLAFRSVGNSQVIEEHESLFFEMVAMVNGRVYYKISNWYTLLSFLPLHKKIIPIWEEMLGIEQSATKNTGISLRFGQRLKTYGNVLKSFFKVPIEMDQLNQEFEAIEALFITQFNHQMSNQDVFALYDELKEKVLLNWDITLLNDLYAFLYTGWLKRAMKRRKIDNYEEITNQLISGMGSLASMKPIVALQDLARLIISDNQVQEVQQVQTAEQADLYLSQGLVGKAMRTYLTQFGDRSLEELKLETETFRSKPLNLFKELQHYLKEPELLNALTSKEATAHQTILPERVKGNRHLTQLSRKAMLGIKHRESSRLNRSRLYGMVRSLFTQVGQNLQTQDVIEAVDDVFYLTITELKLIETWQSGEAKVRITERKKDYRQFSQLPTYSRLIYEATEFDKHVVSIDSGKIIDTSKELVGVPCSPGIVEGQVVIIEDPKTMANTQGKILVTKMTDPGWVFLLARAKGIITEKGSLLSHTAIISRELQIPAVVGVKDVTQLLENDEWVTLNALTGKITRRQPDVSSH
ncbi:phosphoenolpyruvate synthase [Vagococcus sp. BWB3-3]|uniref:Phosphoenolpyruvate synthase n=1 Tax=Vagococcus allomyrinae TaxID=2794353 RepID=A0A940SZH3_9ENTE|nr:phosphoenolpyruvate synthase [Vagococcus allomyrinae]MBP1044428.1 phosphoenolpyruvate synthase [Vagococcus allomyrinae]